MLNVQKKIKLNRDQFLSSVIKLFPLDFLSKRYHLILIPIKLPIYCGLKDKVLVLDTLYCTEPVLDLCV